MDPRKGLGLRPGKIPELRLNLGDDLLRHDEAGARSSSLTVKKSPSFRDLSLPSPRSPLEPTFATPRSPSLSIGEFQSKIRRIVPRPKEPPNSAKETPRGLYESQKLLSHVLDRLESRHVPPDTLKRAARQAQSDATSTMDKRRSASGVKQLGQAVVGVAQSGLQVGQSSIGTTRGNSSEDGSEVGSQKAEKEMIQGWDSDGTYALVEQLRDLLLLADRQGLRLLDKIDGPKTHITNNQSALYTPRYRVMGVLRVLSSADGHYSVTKFTPLHPPKALQAACLDIATYLYHTAGKVEKFEVLDTVLDMMTVFKQGMLERVYEWLEGRIGDVLAGLDHRSIQTSASDPSSTSEGSDVSLRMSSLVTRSLNNICDTIGDGDQPLLMRYRIHRLLRLILSGKSDVTLDLLDIAAYAQPHSRRNAIRVLSTYYPLSVGHNIIARRPQSVAYAAQLERWETGQLKGREEDEVEAHHYIHWRISSKDQSTRPLSACSICEGDIHGFCIKCTLCYDVQHLGCYRSEEGMFQYEILNNKPGSPPTVVNVKFSRQLATLEEKLEAGTALLTPLPAIHQIVGQHDLYRVHLFTSTPCPVCSKPIWADPSAVYACFGGCQSFFHTGCIDYLAKTPCQFRQVWPDTKFEVTFGALEFSYSEATRSLSSRTAELVGISSDEVSILYGALWIRYQTLKAGLGAGSLVILSEGDQEVSSDPLDLRIALRAYENFLQTPFCPCCPAMSDFIQVHGFDGILGQGYLFNDSYLAYITALLKSPNIFTSDRVTAPVVSYSALPVNDLCEILKTDLSIRSDLATKILIDHISSLGLTRKLERSESPAPGQIIFNLLSLVDCSASVTVLIDCITACLDTLDLTMVEQGLILLINRGWPSVLCASDDLDKLGAAVLAWVTSEEEVLHRIVREYASRHRPLPGLRTLQGVLTSRTSGPVQLYQEARNGLLRQYIQPWLEALYLLDDEAYADILYESCRAPVVDHLQGFDDHQSIDGAVLATLAIERIALIIEAGIASSCVLRLLTDWLDDLGELADQDLTFKSLPRLISRHLSPPPGSTGSLDIFTLATDMALSSVEDLARSCRWMRVLSSSGVEIPWRIIRHLIEVESQSMRQVIEVKVDIAIAIQANTAYLDPREFADICVKLLVVFVAGMLEEEIGTDREDDRFGPYLDILFRLILRSHGVSVEQILSTSLCKTKDNASHKSEPKIGRRPIVPAFRNVALDQGLITAILELISLTVYPVTPLLDLLWLLFTQASFVVSADETIYALTQNLYSVIWHLPNLEMDRRSRLRLMLKVITVNPAPLESMINSELSRPDRSEAIERLLRLVLDLGDITHAPDGKQWRAAVVDLVLLLLASISDPGHSDPASMAVRQSISPAQLLSMSLTIEESLLVSSDERRQSILIKSRQLRLTFTSWPVLDDLLTETMTSIKQLAPGKSNLRCILAALGLDMLASGIGIPYIAAQRFQQHVAALCALPWQEPSEGLVDMVLPALRDLLDSPRQISTSATESELGETRKMALVGSLFVPAVMGFGAILGDKGVLAQMCILDILLVTFYKQNVVPVLQPALKTLLDVAIFVEQPGSAESRILGLSVILAALDRMRREDLVHIVPSVFISLAATLKRETTESGNGTIADQCRNLLRRMIKLFGKAGLMLNIVRLHGSDPKVGMTGNDFAAILLRLYPTENVTPDSITITSLLTLLFDDLSDVLKRGRQALEHILSGLSRIIPALIQSMRTSHVESYGSFLSRLGKHVAEWTSVDFDPEITLNITASILQVEKVDYQSSLFLGQAATFLQLCLSRFDVSISALGGLLAASASLCANLKTNAICRAVVSDQAALAMQGLAVTPVTLSTLLQFLASSATDDPSKETIVMASEGCVPILLRQHTTFTTHRQDPLTNLDIFDRASHLSLLSDTYEAGTLGKRLIPILSESLAQQMGVFTSLFLSASTSATGQLPLPVLGLYPVLARLVTSTLRRVADLIIISNAEAAGQGAEALSSVFIVTRLAFIAVNERTQTTQTPGDGSAVLDAFWTAVCAEWIRLISLTLENLCVNKPLKTTTHSAFLDTVIFLGTVQNLQLNISHTASLTQGLEVLIDYTERTGAGGGKLLRAVALMEQRESKIGHDLLGAVERGRLLEIVKVDVTATERMKALRST